MRYVASLISGVGIFCVGSGLSFYHGVVGLIEPHGMDDFYWVRYHVKMNITVPKSFTHISFSRHTIY